MHFTQIVQQITYCNSRLHNLCRNCLCLLQFLEISDYVIHSSLSLQCPPLEYLWCAYVNFFFGDEVTFSSTFPSISFQSLDAVESFCPIKYAAGCKQQQLVILNFNKTNSLDKGQQNLNRGFPQIMPALQFEMFVSRDKMEEQTKPS